MIKQMLVAIVLMLLVVGNWDAEASGQNLGTQKIVDFHRSEAKVREKRFINPLTSLFGIWNAVKHMYQLYSEQKNETKSAIEQTYDIIADGFNDTYLSTKRPTTTTTAAPNAEPASSTQRYRISRKEFGYILGKNYRGLKKLFNIEIMDALNQSKYNIAEYRREKALALAPYTVKKFQTKANQTTSE